MAMILNEEQTMLKDSAKDFCTANAPITQLRELRDSENADGFDQATWNSMVELGWAAIPWGEEHGGLAFGYKGLGVVTEESGRTLTASPLVCVRLGRWHITESRWFRCSKVGIVAKRCFWRAKAGFGAGRVSSPQSLQYFDDSVCVRRWLCIVR